MESTDDRSKHLLMVVAFLPLVCDENLRRWDIMEIVLFDPDKPDVSILHRTVLMQVDRTRLRAGDPASFLALGHILLTDISTVFSGKELKQQEPWNVDAIRAIDDIASLLQTELDYPKDVRFAIRDMIVRPSDKDNEKLIINGARVQLTAYLYCGACPVTENKMIRICPIADQITKELVGVSVETALAGLSTTIDGSKLPVDADGKTRLLFGVGNMVPEDLEGSTWRDAVLQPRWTKPTDVVPYSDEAGLIERVHATKDDKAPAVSLAIWNNYSYSTSKGLLNEMCSLVIAFGILTREDHVSQENLFFGKNFNDRSMHRTLIPKRAINPAEKLQLARTIASVVEQLLMEVDIVDVDDHDWLEMADEANVDWNYTAILQFCRKLKELLVAVYDKEGVEMPEYPLAVISGQQSRDMVDFMYIMTLGEQQHYD